VSVPLTRKVFVALALLAPSLLFAVTADASPVRKARVRSHRAVARHVMTPSQAFAHVAAKNPERRVYRHPPTWLEKGHHQTNAPDHDAAIQNSSSPASTESAQDAPTLRPLELLAVVQAQIQSHEGYALSSPRAPPAFN
jgi:hypothetical protein